MLTTEGYTGQQTDQPIGPDRPDNLDHYVPGDRGAHGPFDDRSRPHSLELWARMHWPGLLGAATVLGLGATALARRRH